MLSLFTAMATNAMNAALDGTKCKDIDGKEVISRKNMFKVHHNREFAVFWSERCLTVL